MTLPALLVAAVSAGRGRLCLRARFAGVRRTAPAAAMAVTR